MHPHGALQLHSRRCLCALHSVCIPGLPPGSLQPRRRQRCTKLNAMPDVDKQAASNAPVSASSNAAAAVAAVLQAADARAVVESAHRCTACTSTQALAVLQHVAHVAAPADLDMLRPTVCRFCKPLVRGVHHLDAAQVSTASAALGTLHIKSPGTVYPLAQRLRALCTDSAVRTADVEVICEAVVHLSNAAPCNATLTAPEPSATEADDPAQSDPVSKLLSKPKKDRHSVPKLQTPSASAAVLGASIPDGMASTSADGHGNEALAQGRQRAAAAIAGAMQKRLDSELAQCSGKAGLNELQRCLKQVCSMFSQQSAACLSAISAQTA